MARTANEGAWCGLSASIRGANNRLVFMRGMSAMHGGVDSRCGQRGVCFHGCAGCNALCTDIPTLHDGIDMSCAEGARRDAVPAVQHGLLRARRIASGAVRELRSGG
ncbi:hypothetical protein [Burkholderia lata]|uniref:hypothetical protein n=1 Tax=Burkholderia lata (strain ATCC 17760 / DSM 23089 / LMG 22485 / NCIMB 9086 / R18194 / 383) TaxID=482957 RepID=UPI001582C63E|nr:hypothetical protein [Burkholderia lata]